MHRIALLLASLTLTSIALSSPSTAAAQEEEAPRSQPRWQVSFMLPRLSAAYVTRESEGVAIAEAEVRVAHAAGHGLFLRGGMRLDETQFFPFLDGDYLYRITLTGDARLGLALDLAAGISYGFAGGSNGAHIGGNLGATLVLHAEGFTIDLDLRYTMLSPLDIGPWPSTETPETEHMFTAGIGFGFTF